MPQSVVCWWRIGRPNPCVIVVFLAVAYHGTWDFTPWCSRKGGKGVRGSWPAPTGLAVVGMSWNLRLVVVVVLIVH